MKFIYGSVALLLSGCAIQAIPYEAPAGSINVNFTVENRLSHSMFVHAYNDAKECQGRRLISFLQSRHSKAVGIPVEKEFAYSLTALVPNSKYCKMAVSFHPENENEYFSTMDYDQANNICLLSLKKRSREGVVETVEPFYTRELGGLILDESSSFCKKRN